MNTERHRNRGRRFDREPIARGLCSLDDNSTSSSSNQSTTTTNIDKRIAAGAGSIISGDGSPITVNSIDAGAVHDAFGFASDVAHGALDTTNQALSTVAASEKSVADAYSTAKAGEQKVLVGIALAIVAVVAVAALKGLRHG